MGPHEGLAAGGTGVGADAGMDAHVSRQATRVQESLAAGGAGVGAVAIMGAHVSRQVAGRREGLAAGGAGVGAVARMGAHVSRQVAGRREGLAANSARQVQLARRLDPPSLTHPGSAPTPSFSRRLFPPPRASDRSQIKRHGVRPLRVPQLLTPLSALSTKAETPCSFRN